MLRLSLSNLSRRNFQHHLSRAPAASSQRNKKQRTKLMYKDDDYSSATAGGETALTSRARFVSDGMALRQQAQLKAQSSQNESSSSSRMRREEKESSNSGRHFSPSSSSATVSRSVVSRAAPLVQLPRHEQGNGRMSNPVESLPSATLLRRTTYADALKYSSPTPIVDADDQEMASSREAATLRLQSYAHHEKLIPSVTSEHTEARTAMMRCRRCGLVFAHRKAKQQESLKQQRGHAALVRSRALVAMAARPTCGKCGSSEVESLMQHLHIRNNARKH